MNQIRGKRKCSQCQWVSRWGMLLILILVGMSWGASTWQITGLVCTAEGMGVPGVVMTGSNGAGWTITGTDGSYALVVPDNWLGTVSASRTGWLVTPASKSYGPVQADFTNENYVAYLPKISGYIRLSGVGLAGVTVITSTVGSVLSQSDGYYEFHVPYGWNGNVSAAKPGFNITPGNIVFNTVTTDQSNKNFSAFQPMISGAITAYGSGLAGVMLIADNEGGTVITDPSGNYNLKVPYGWSGTINPVKEQYTFTPSQKTYNNLTSNSTSQNYTGILPPVSISGYVRDSHGSGVAGVSILMSGGSTSTDANGYYILNIPYNWSGNVTANKAGFMITPSSYSYNQISFDQTDRNYVTFQPRIAGIITAYSRPLAGVTLTASNGGGTAQSDEAGYYSMTVPYNWSGSVTPSKPQCTFNPTQKTYSNLTHDNTWDSFNATFPPVNISGLVLDRYQTGVSGVSLTANNNGGSGTTDANGYYAISVPYNWSGSVTAAQTGYSINPPSITYTNVTAEQMQKNYAAFQPTISGYVTFEGRPLAGVTLTASNNGGSVISDEDGYYSFIVNWNWSGNIIATRTGFNVTPASITLYNIRVDQIEKNFSAFQPTISGIITAYGEPLAGVRVAASDGSAETQTDATGTYSINVAYGWSGNLTSSKSLYYFDPLNRTYINLMESRSGQDYMAKLAPVYSGGSGEAEDAFVIANTGDWVELTNTKQDWNKYFIVTADLDFDGALLNPIAPDADSAAGDFQGVKFTGSIDGGEHVLRDLVIDWPDSDYVGIIGYIDTGGEIKNLHIEDVQAAGRAKVGGLAGDNHGTITNCRSNASVAGTNYVGGLAGYNAGMISGCRVRGENGGDYEIGGLVGRNGGSILYSCANTIVSGSFGYVGGLVGSNSGTIAACYSQGCVSGDFYLGGYGGLLGNNTGTISSCYAATLVEGTTNVGGLIGRMNAGTVNGSFWDKDVSTQTNTAGGGEGKTLAQMQIADTFIAAGWDFRDDDGDAADWIIRDGWGYPRLAWQGFTPGDVAEGYEVNLADYKDMEGCWQTENGDPEFVEELDLDGGGVIGVGDLGIFCGNWLEAE